jgi:co-chaperonin GroES (HSP10)
MITPTQGKVLLSPIVEKSEVLGIVSKTTDKAKVEAVGLDCELEVGMVVLIPKTQLSRFSNEDGEYLLMDESDILAVL